MAKAARNRCQGWLFSTALVLMLLSVGQTQAAGYLALDGSSHRVSNQVSNRIQNSFNEELEPGGLRLRLGMPLAPMLDVELHLGGARESQTTVADQFSTIYAGGFLKGYLPIGSWSALYAMAGASLVDFTQTIGDIDYTDERSGFSWGVGLETQLSQRLDISADYVRYISVDDPFSELSSVSLGLKWYF